MTAHRSLRNRSHAGDPGFSLVELLVVIVILGILAAIALPTFLNQRHQGWEKSTMAELRNAAAAQAFYATEHDGTYASSAAELRADGYNQSPDQAADFSIVVFNAPGHQVHCIQSKHRSYDQWYAELSSDGQAVRGKKCPDALRGDRTDQLVDQ